MQISLLIDIGNTNTSLAVVREKRIAKRYFIRTSREQISSKALKRLLGRNLDRIDKVVVVSVVPEFLRIMKKAIKKILPKTRVFIVGKNVRAPIKNKYRKPKEVGQDRLVAAFAARKLFGSPVVSVDFGTAVTLDFVNKKGEYEGGLIFPGLRLALASLEEEAALLPKVDIKPTKGLIGRTTKGSMNNGILYGYASMCDGLIDRLKKKYGKSLKVVATGGDAKLVSKYSRNIKNINPDLVFTGLQLLPGKK
ncbi:MAG: type III pantothenate kinase [Candidatus Omnitrophota bacterium]|jgi:type III pantothenate kinase